MASKLRRTPLFGYDGNLGIPIMPATSSAKAQNANYVYQHGGSMDVVAVSAAATRYASEMSSSSGSDSSSVASVKASVAARPNKASSSHSPSTPNKHVNFGGGGGGPEEKRREKFLTAKYGAHQMALIRKRLRVEMWMYERLQEIYGADDIEIDLDEVLDMDCESERKEYISSLLRESHRINTDKVDLFVGDLLEKVKTL